MRQLTTLSVTASLLLTAAVAASTAPAALAQNVPTYKIDVSASRTWTNDDIDQLRREAPISFFTPEAPPSSQIAQAAPATPAPVVAVTSGPPRIVDPHWYADQAAQLQAELDRRRSALAQYIQAIQDARSREHMSSGIALDKGNVAITPEADIEILQTRVEEVESQLEDLADLARQNGIDPGGLRG